MSKGFGRNFKDETERPCVEKPSLAKSVSSAAGAVAAEGVNVVNRRGDEICSLDFHKYESEVVELQWWATRQVPMPCGMT
ncbi:hypothetical protein AgCh_033750 [Apium graveolens]